MRDINNPYPPIQYDRIWLYIGISILTLVLVWYCYVFWLTKFKKIKRIDDLSTLEHTVNLEQIKQKYLALIEDIYKNFTLKKITIHELTQGLSMLVRYFIYEASGFPAPLLTLSDLYRSRHSELAHTVAKYYPVEFSKQTASPEQCVTLAKEFIKSWKA